MVLQIVNTSVYNPNIIDIHVVMLIEQYTFFIFK